MALVIGNSNYEHVPALRTPLSDANAMTQSLTSLGFEVLKGLDLDHRSMDRSFREFVRKSQSAEISLFFYAGHVLQANQHNYLVPIDAHPVFDSDIEFELIDLQQKVVKFMGGRNRTGIVLLDASRPNPLTAVLKGTFKKGSSSIVVKGLAPMHAESGQLIGFSDLPNSIAVEGMGKHSAFTTALLKHLPTTNVEFEQMLKRVKNEVWASTDNKQQPWHSSALHNEVYLAGRR